MGRSGHGRLGVRASFGREAMIVEVYQMAAAARARAQTARAAFSFRESGGRRSCFADDSVPLMSGRDSRLSMLSAGVAGGVAMEAAGAGPRGAAGSGSDWRNSAGCRGAGTSFSSNARISSSPLRRVEEDGAFSGPRSCGEGVWVSIPVVWEGAGSVGWGPLGRTDPDGLPEAGQRPERCA